MPWEHREIRRNFGEDSQRFINSRQEHSYNIQETKRGIAFTLWTDVLQVYISESNKTGNKATKQFLFEKEMQEILHDDPTFKPVCSIPNENNLVYYSAFSGILVFEIKRKKKDIRVIN